MSVQANPNVVPLCDILLVLLIIFMVISPIAQNGMDVFLPETGESGNTGPIVLSLENDGQMYLNSEVLPDNMSLSNRLKDIFNIRRDRTLYVQAAREVLYKEVIKSMDIAKLSGVEVICVIPYTAR